MRTLPSPSWSTSIEKLKHMRYYTEGSEIFDREDDHGRSFYEAISDDQAQTLANHLNSPQTGFSHTPNDHEGGFDVLGPDDETLVSSVPRFEAESLVALLNKEE
jgi:hypothetical protein